MDSRPAQRQIYELLREVFNPADVKLEWPIQLGATDRFRDPGIYAPRLDIAVGPFNSTTSNVFEDIRAIQSAVP